MNITIFNGNNDQGITIAGLIDQTQTLSVGAVITGVLMRGGVPLVGGSITFVDVAGKPGTYTGMLVGFDAPAGGAQIEVSGTHTGNNFGFTSFCTIAQRSL